MITAAAATTTTAIVIIASVGAENVSNDERL